MPGAGEEPTPEEVNRAAARLREEFDPVHGGLGGAPKFPRALELGFLLSFSRIRGDAQARHLLAFTLEHMARGGIYDQAGGGFHRYTVDAAWVVPHFEKMLYDNALLPPLYLAHHQMSGSPLSRRLARETLDFVLREMTAPQGGFYAAWDADSEGEEGKFYVWTLGEIQAVVGPEKAPLMLAALGVTEAGNFEGKNVLTRPHAEEELARRFSIPVAEVEQVLQSGLAQLHQARALRVPPHRDEKVITAWNGLMISALAAGAQVLGERRYGEAAARAAALSPYRTLAGGSPLSHLGGRPGQYLRLPGRLRLPGQCLSGPVRDRLRPLLAGCCQTPGGPPG